MQTLEIGQMCAKVVRVREHGEGPKGGYYRNTSYKKAPQRQERCLFCLSLFVHYLRRRQWHPTPVLLPGKSHGWRSLVGCSPWGCYESVWLNDFTFTFHFHALEKEMATHSSVLTWRIPGTGEPGGLPSMGSHRVGHNWSALAAAVHYLAQKRCSIKSVEGREREREDGGETEAGYDIVHSRRLVKRPKGRA